MGTTLPPELLNLLPGPLLIAIGWAIAVCLVASMFLRLVPAHERNRAAYRYLRPAIIWTAFLLALAVMVTAVVLYIQGAFSGPPAPPG